MVSIQIWVTWFHIHCTGELEQVYLASAVGCPFLSTGLGKQHHKQLATTRDAFVHSLPWRNDTTKPPAAKAVQVSQASPQGPQDLLQPSPTEAEGEWELSGEKVTLSASRAAAACRWKQPLSHGVCFGFQGCNHGWLAEELNSERGLFLIPVTLS